MALKTGLYSQETGKAPERIGFMTCQSYFKDCGRQLVILLTSDFSIYDRRQHLTMVGEEVLADNKDEFVHWRYVFENQSSS